MANPPEIGQVSSTGLDSAYEEHQYGSEAGSNDGSQRQQTGSRNGPYQVLVGKRVAAEKTCGGACVEDVEHLCEDDHHKGPCLRIGQLETPIQCEVENIISQPAHNQSMQHNARAKPWRFLPLLNCLR